MKKYFLIMLLIGQLALVSKICAQNIAINGTGDLPDTSAMLDISSVDKGFLAPRMSTAQQNAIPLPANGLLVFNTTDNVFMVNTGTTASPVWTPLATGTGSITSMNGLTPGLQTFATGTAGTNFGISSSGFTHTFNIPTASASNRGALSSADWTKFNAKQSAITLATTGNAGAATFSAGTLNIPVYTLAGLGGIGLTALSTSAPLNYNNTTGVFSISQATTLANGYLSSVDWNTFNNKQTALNGTGYLKFSGTTASYFSSIPNSDLVNSAITIQGTSIPLGGSANIINGTGFVKATGTTISYDNSAYLTTSSAATTYEPVITVPNTIQKYLNGYKKFVSLNTDSVPEGVSNLYYTNARARTAISLTTTGTSGAASYNNATGVLNVPAYTTNVGTVTSVSALALGTTGTDLSSTVAMGTSTPVITLNVPTASATSRGVLSAADWNSFNDKQALLVSGTNLKTVNSSSLIGSGNVSVEPVITAPNTTLKYWTGYKTYGSFPDSVRTAISLTTSGSGVATYNNTTGVLNVPNYAVNAWSLKGNSGITQPAAPATYGTTTLGASENFFGTTDVKDLVLATNNLERMRILSNAGSTGGYVGIGTSTPDKPLVLISNIANVGLVKLQNTNSTGYSSIDFWNTTTMVGNIGFSNSGATFPNAFYFATNTSNAMVFATNNTERFRVDGTTGNVGIGLTTPTALLHLDGGTASAGTASLKINDGTILSSIEKGTIEKDANVFYLTPDATNRGVLPSVSYSVLNSDFALTNVTTAQSVFSSGQDNINVSASTTYEFEAQYILSTGNAVHTTSTLFGGTATFTSISYVAELSSGNAMTQTTTISKTNINSNSAPALNINSVNPETVIQLKGILRINAGGTMIPQIKFGAAPGGINICLANSYFKLTPIGNNTVSKIGSWF